MLVALTLALQIEPADILGRTFHDLELHNKYAGQILFPLSPLPHDGEDDALR